MNSLFVDSYYSYDPDDIVCTKRHEDTCDTWRELVSNNSYYKPHLQTEPPAGTNNGITAERAAGADNHQNGTTHHQPPVPAIAAARNNGDVMPTLKFSSVSESLVFISRGRDTRLRVVDDVNVRQNSLINLLPRCLAEAEHVLVLCTGSLYLVGLVLSILDPDVCEK